MPWIYIGQSWDDMAVYSDGDGYEAFCVAWGLVAEWLVANGGV